MFCSYCGKELRDGSKFCAHCGKELPTESVIPEAAPPAGPAEPVAAPVVEPALAVPETPAVPPAPEPPAQPKQETPAPVPPAQPPKAPKPPKVKKEKKPADPGALKKALGNIALLLGLTALYAGISLLFLLYWDREDAVVTQTAYNSNICGYLSLREFVDLLLNGNRIFHPTVLSTALGVGIYGLSYAVPAFCLLALIGAATGKRTTSLCVTSSVFTALCALMTAGLVPASMLFVKGLDQACALQSGVMFQDIARTSWNGPFVCAGIALVLMVGTIILTAILKKRRAQHGKV